MASNHWCAQPPAPQGRATPFCVRATASVLSSAAVSGDKPSVVVKGTGAAWRICPECGTRLMARRCPSCKTTSVPALLLEGGSVAEPVVGMILGDQYELLELLGEGGMGKVFRANQLSMDREIAVKIISREISSDLDSIRRFQREAKVTSRLSDPHSIRVFDFGITDEGLFYLAMELLRGRELLDEIVGLGHLSVDRSLDIAIQTLTALQEAHEQGIVHRDLKPTNVFLRGTSSEPDFVKVMDFGIAKASFAEEYQRVTQTGMIVGTPKYMSPEQARGFGADARSDIYAVGIMLHEMIVGEAPFEHESPVQVLLMHISEPLPRLAELRPGIRSVERVQAMVDRLVAKEPDDRPANVVYAVSELQALRDSLSGSRSRKATQVEGDVTAEADVVQIAAQAAALQPEPDAEDLAPTGPSEAVREGQIDTAPFAVPAAAKAAGGGVKAADDALPAGFAARTGDRATLPGVAVPVPEESGGQHEPELDDDERLTQAFSVVTARGEGDEPAVAAPAPPEVEQQPRADEPAKAEEQPRAEQQSAAGDPEASASEPDGVASAVPDSVAAAVPAVEGTDQAVAKPIFRASAVRPLPGEHENRTMLLSLPVTDANSAETVAIDVDRINAATEDRVKVPPPEAQVVVKPSRWPYVVGALLLLVLLGAATILVLDARKAGAPALLPAAASPAVVPAAAGPAVEDKDAGPAADAGSSEDEAIVAADGGGDASEAVMADAHDAHKPDAQASPHDAGVAGGAADVAQTAAKAKKRKRKRKRRKRRRPGKRKIRSPYLMD